MRDLKIFDQENELTTLHWHEALDRTYMLSEMLDFVDSLEVVQSNKELVDLSDKVAIALGNLYNGIANENPFNK